MIFSFFQIIKSLTEDLQAEKDADDGFDVGGRVTVNDVRIDGT